ncbi:hypothetical protein D9B85_08500 [Corynebacterium diphtheriae]|nr:hypothetical protein BKD85_02610 [Corynebacterium diphtheriae]OWM96171.1 hypothetical protein AY481_07670 [Corynebacterium diphtheriae bv. mitis]OFI65585.1 hypothetical protein BKD81_02605 [Corynebacterium diphtheriae]OJH97386.1 hypothetical protein BJU21_11230 [Corynebacterium diphtheriae]OKY21835.1 hypothetical protein AO271_03005 [Corynebacterium diphtheriae]
MVWAPTIGEPPTSSAPAAAVAATAILILFFIVSPWTDLIENRQAKYLFRHLAITCQHDWHGRKTAKKLGYKVGTGRNGGW